VTGYISQLTYELRLRITIKVFATSTKAVREMRGFFPHDSILNFSTILSSGNPRIGGVYREIEAGFAD
jgi:hypothetical protein